MPNVNLLAWRDHRRQQKIWRFLKIVLLYFLFTAVLLCKQWAELSIQHHILLIHLDALNQQDMVFNQHLQTLMQTQTELHNLQQQQRAVAQLYDKRQQLIDFLTQTEESLPDLVWLKQLVFTEQRLLLDGSSINVPAVFNLSQQIVTLPNVKESRIKNMSKPSADQSYFNFTLLTSLQ